MTQNETVKITQSVHIFSNLNRAEANEKDNFNMSLNLSSF
jgi:hypothetical protein